MFAKRKRIGVPNPRQNGKGGGRPASHLYKGRAASRGISTGREKTRSLPRGRKGQALAKERRKRERRELHFGGSSSDAPAKNRGRRSKYSFYIRKLKKKTRELLEIGRGTNQVLSTQRVAVPSERSHPKGESGRKFLLLALLGGKVGDA